jgi:hypothetical protein
MDPAKIKRSWCVSRISDIDFYGITSGIEPAYTHSGKGALYCNEMATCFDMLQFLWGHPLLPWQDETPRMHVAYQLSPVQAPVSSSSSFSSSPVTHGAEADDQAASVEDEGVRMCPCGDVLTIAEAVADVEAALVELGQTNFPLTEYYVEPRDRMLTQNRSRVMFTLGRLKGAAVQQRLIRVEGDEAYVQRLADVLLSHGCNCDRLLCRDFPCCRDANGGSGLD